MLGFGVGRWEMGGEVVSERGGWMGMEVPFFAIVCVMNGEEREWM